MLFEEISLTPQDILDKEFKIDTRGYRPQEVDKFLDVIIGDYTKFIALVKRLDSEKKALIEDNLRLKKELREAQDKIELLKNTSSKEITNVDMLRRISMLEKAVFRDNDNNYNSVKVCNPNGKNVSLISQYNNGNNTVWFKIAIVTISGNSITFGNREEVKLVKGSSPSISSSSNIYITRVVGY